MRPLGPFEAAPLLAVATSGGADSLALALLAERWARQRGGHIRALTVNHGLRPAATAEATEVGRWLARRAIAHRVLAWPGAKPRAGVAAAAREARYGLLQGYCRRHGILHLLLAHQAEDQAETFLLRLGRASGAAGLAAMAAVAERADLRLLRPLLSVARARLEATLARAGQPWIDDPANRDRTRMRPRLRSALPALARAGFEPAVLASAARAFAAERGELEAAVASLLARAVRYHPAGRAWLDPAVFRAAGPDVAVAALAALLQGLGRRLHPPRGERLARLHAALSRGLVVGRTLGACRLVPVGGRILVVPEAGPNGCSPSDPSASGMGAWAGEPCLAYRRVGPRLASVSLASVSQVGSVVIRKGAGLADARNGFNATRALTAPTFMLVKGASGTI
ncbi:MAG: tRNA lysidine(34) synthetase TilS [Alphaproteobacteria bacterium]|nr:tRNA lysidine(34) synthetase TilS [Alphaproteobacteria bacterium]